MFRKIQGNARGCLIYEPMFIVPYSMLTMYATVYMFQLGVNERQIGWITSIGLVMQIFTSILSGYLTDRMGRRRALLYYDLVSWSAAALIWAVSQNFWYFLAAAVLNSFLRVPNTAWYCLLVEDTHESDRSQVFRILQLIGVIGGLFAPLGGLLVNHFTLVPAMRILYVMFFISLTIMFFARNFATHETEIGIRKRSESSTLQVKDTLRAYAGAVKAILAKRALLIIFGVYICSNFQVTMQNAYLSIYLVEALNMNDALISIFPAISSVAMLVLMFLVVPRLQENRAYRYMIGGFLLMILSKVVLIAAAPGQISLIIVSTMLAAAGSIISSPYLEAVVANSIDDDQRANMFSILQVLVLLCISPTGVIGGWTYTIDPRLPFILMILTSMASIVLMLVLMRSKSVAASS
ncbi:MFS transporter [Paenibacillus sp. GCM10023248]|uniref:MFS transporter n=1 Tax=Bacillales TaxID=1385 RepID=UPI0023797B66|nr:MULTISPECIES: MFS transporter [Bacillales]MDD9269106.1 MFS transporter [Paenibacillus sp. MAHUQ-63]MDR6880673.1 MFS family permease [Bacillus sp. 3255]